jgi:hypothetical protein
MKRTTTTGAYRRGQAMRIVYTPQPVGWGSAVDCGHIALVVTNHDGSEGSIGYFGRSYRDGLFSAAC